MISMHNPYIRIAVAALIALVIVLAPGALIAFSGVSEFWYMAIAILLSAVVVYTASLLLTVRRLNPKARILPKVF